MASAPRLSGPCDLPIPEEQSLSVQSENVIRSCLIEPLRLRAKIVYLEDFVRRLESNVKLSTSQVKTLREFRHKYFFA